jgi:hypothetical protein
MRRKETNSAYNEDVIKAMKEKATRHINLIRINS